MAEPVGTVPGQTIVVDPASPVGWSWQTPPPSPFVTGFFVDFSLLPNQNLAADGAVTIGGKTFTIANRAAAQTFAIQNGSGLYLRCNAVSSSNYATVRTGPLIEASLTDLASGAWPGNYAELWVKILWSQPHTPNADFEFAQMGIVPKPYVFSSQYTLIYGERGYSSSLGNVLAYLNLNGVEAHVAGYNQTDDVLAFRVLANNQVEIYSGASDAGNFPANSSLNLIGQVMLDVTAGISKGPLSGGNGRAQWALIMAAQSGNTAAHSDLLIKQIGIYYR